MRTRTTLSQELIMKKIALTALSVVILAASSSVFAQGKTRAEVYQELIEAQKNGLDYITDASYPEVNPAFTHRVEQLKAQAAAEKAAGRVASGSAAVGSAN
jgi:Domain of unknown function (DUF4148)